MVTRPLLGVLILGVVLATTVIASGQQVGSIRGMVYDKDFDAPLGGAQVLIVERNEKVVSGEEGNFVFSQVPPGTYTLVFSKDGFTRQVKGDVVVTPGQMSEVSASLPGEFTDMDEFVCQDPKIGGGTEDALLALRVDNPALISGVSSELMSKAAASNASDALRLVSGASVQDDKYAVIRGLPDRYVASLMNGVRLPSADVDKRAVQLDQFPSAVIERMEVTKTFTPDQQGDASGGAVNIVLKGIPEENMFKFEFGGKYDTQASLRKDFLTSKGGGVNCFGWDKRDIPSSGVFDSAVGVSEGSAPFEGSWSMVAGGKHYLGQGWKLGGLASLFYKRDASYYDDGVRDSLWVTQPGEPLTPKPRQGSPSQGDFKTSLYDVTQSTEEVQWGGLGVVGVEDKNNWLRILYMYTRSAKDTTTLAEDTRGKKYYFPGYDVNDPSDPGNQEAQAAPYLRNETLLYTERTTQTWQLSGRHTLQVEEVGVDEVFKLLQPTLDWTGALSSSTLYQPDKRQFASEWQAPSEIAGFEFPAVYVPLRPSANANMGNFQRIWRDVSEDSSQAFANLKYPFQQWSGDKGYFKTGVFYDKVDRQYEQDSFSNNANGFGYRGGWNDLWTSHLRPQDIAMTPSEIDVDYTGEQKISAFYYMADMPLCSWLNVVGGVRHEKTELSIVNTPDDEVLWFPNDSQSFLRPGEADVAFQQRDTLPSLGLVFKPHKTVKIHAVYSETVARQTFKELTPIQQQEFLGGDTFIGNPGLQMAALKNYDLRLDYTPTDDTLYSIGWFYKDVKNPIEYVQRDVLFTYTTPVNYPEGYLTGIELEARQKMGRIAKWLEGVTLGGNVTLIDSQVTLPREEAAELRPWTKDWSKRDMTGAPEFLYNLYCTYDLERTGTQFATFYTVKGDTLASGAALVDGGYIPSVYEKQYGTLNFTVTQKLSKHWKLKFQAKNVLNPLVETVYRTDDGEATRSSYRKGMEFYLGMSAEW